MLRSAASHGGSGRIRAAALLGLAGAALVAAWIGAGIRSLGPDEFAVLRGPRGTRLVPHGRLIAPPGLLSVAVYPRAPVELPLPQAEEAALSAPDGSGYGFRGWATLRAREDDWRALEAATGDGGLRRGLLDALREAADGFRPPRGRTGLTPVDRRRIEVGLREGLARRGIELERLELDSIDRLVVDDRASPAATRLLVVALDGADWAILDPLIEAGRLPTLARLAQEGTRARLLSISPMLSPVIWTSVATGVEPTRHGILDFLVADPQGGSRQPVTSAQRLVPTFWELLSRAGVPVGVVGWWATWPADPVRGYLVSDRIAYQLFGYRADADDARGKTWPPELYAEIRPRIRAPESIGWNEVEPYLEGPRRAPGDFEAEERALLDEFRTLLASTATHLDVALELRERYRPDLEIVYFEGTDTVGHLFMPYRPPRLAGVAAERVAAFGGVVDRYYETIDRHLARLLEGRGEEWTTVILSDHGFAADATRPLTADSRIGHGAAAAWHRRFGVLILHGNRVRAGTRLEEASIYDVAPTVLALFGQPVPESWPGRVLADALDPRFLERHPVRHTATEPPRGEPSDLAGLDPAAADLVEKLRGLGYVGSAAGGDALTARVNRGVSLLAEGRAAEAEAELRRGLAEHPGSALLCVNLALALRVQGRDDEALPFLERARASGETRRLAGGELAGLLLEAGRLDDAERIAREVLAAEPGAAELRNTLGQILERRGALDAAEREYLEAVALDPHFAQPRSNLGNLERERGRLERAADWYREAIEADPFFMGAYNNLALVYQAQGHAARAIDLYGRALGKSPDNAIVLNNLASLYFATGDVGEAERLWLRAVEADPDYPSPQNNLAGVAIRAGRLEDAERRIERALELDPAYGDARLNLALIRTRQGRPDDARASLRLAAADPRAAVRAWAELGALELAQGRAAAAAAAFSHAAERAPRDPALLNALGEALARSGREAEAREAWRRSLELDPAQPAVRSRLESR